jgi:molybdenum cofactor cytidylyltransferase
VLAAGKSEHIRKNKLLLQFNEKTIIEGILDALEASPIQEQIVVLGGEIDEVVDAIRPKLGKVKVALNLTPELGMASSVQTGLIVIQNVDAAFLVLGDEPILDSTLLSIMIKALEDNPDALIVVPLYEGKEGHPLLLRRELFSEILGLNYDQTLNNVIKAHGDKTVKVEAAGRQ